MSATNNLLPHSSDDYYYIPLSRRYGNEWEMNFWDAIYYLATHRGLPIQVTTRTVATLMNGQPLTNSRYATVRHHFMRYWKKAVAQGWLLEKTPNSQKAEKINTGTLRYSYRSTKRIYIFDLPGCATGPGVASYIAKPRGYIENNWLRVLKGVYPKRLLNFLLGKLQPSYNVDSQPTAPYTPNALLREFCLQLAQEKKVSVHAGLAAQALDFLGQLKLVDCANGLCRLNWPAFATLPDTETDTKTGQLVYQADWLTAQVENARCAEAALDILHLGQWPPLLFWRIYSDIARLDAAKIELIRRRLSISSTNQPKWAHLLHQMNQAEHPPHPPKMIKSNVAHFDFAHQPVWRVPLNLAEEVVERLAVWQNKVIIRADLVVTLYCIEAPSVAPQPTSPESTFVTLTLTGPEELPLLPEATLPVYYDRPTLYFKFDVTRALQEIDHIRQLMLSIKLKPLCDRWHGQAWLEVNLGQPL